MAVLHTISGSTPKHGTLLIKAPHGSDDPIGPNFRIDDYVSNRPAVADVDAKYEDRFDDQRYYSGDAAS